MTKLQMSYDTYLDKVHGGWIGKCIGGAIGALQENNKGLLSYTEDNVFPDRIPPNDDLDLQILYLQEVLEKKGTRIAPGDLGSAFAAYNLCLANEYSIAIRNYELGIEAPYSGSFNNSYFHHSMGCPIRSEIWGFIAPGHPETAVRYAAMDGSVDHKEESIRGEQFLAAMEANGFFERDIHRLIESGLRHIPRDSETAKCVRYVMELHASEIDWREARQELVNEYGSADASYAVINIGITILALLFGEGDYTRTMLTAVNCGYDTDCTAATAGAILGVMIGADAIPDFWKSRIGEDVVIGTVDIKRYSDKIIDLAKDTCHVGLAMARDDVIAVTFTDAPEDVRPALPLPAAYEWLEIAVDYEGLPSIGYGETTIVTITLTNRAGAEQTGQLKVEGPDHLIVAVDVALIAVPAGGEVRCRAEITVKPDIGVMPQRNILRAAFVQQNRAAAVKTFGLSGAARMKMIGPFWDNYDTTRFDHDPFEEKMPTTLRAMFNSFVNLDRPYVDESFESLDALPGSYVNFHEDKLDPHRHIRYKGPCCVYLVQELYCPEARDNVQLLIGHETPFKLWLNGELVADDREPTMWMPYNRVETVKLKEGINQLAVKLLSYGKTMDFSLQLRSEATKMHLFTDLGYRV
ncbi:ADP-ribosylglycohydrolase family protein [Paenibacillus sp. GCM10027626]|uniref:ADP-ribosylglycohydrolase family protein n=1 Tax=Paenibacillus sp. GCM10027626 TaxID=3273411 RepID=UPI003634755C